MFASKSVKKVRKFISKFLSKVSTGVRDVNDDAGEDVRVLSRSSLDDGEDDVDNGDDNERNGGSVIDDNNEDNNDAHREVYGVGESQRVGAILWDPNYSLECHM